MASLVFHLPHRLVAVHNGHHHGVPGPRRAPSLDLVGTAEGPGAAVVIGRAESMRTIASGMTCDAWVTLAGAVVSVPGVGVTLHDE